MLAMTTSGRWFDDEDETEFGLRVTTEAGQPEGFLYWFAGDAGAEWAFQPVIDGRRLDLLRTLPPEEVSGWIDRNHVRERLCSQIGLPLSVLEETAT